MAAAATALPDYLTSPNATLGDTANWRYGKAPDYSNTRAVYEKSESYHHYSWFGVYLKSTPADVSPTIKPSPLLMSLPAYPTSYRISSRIGR